MAKSLLYYSNVLYLSLQKTVSLLGLVNSANSCIKLETLKTNTATFSLLYIAFFSFLGVDTSNIQESNSLILELAIFYLFYIEKN
jgi:hypothetical protein